MTQENYNPAYPEMNTLGLVGFIVSLLGILSAGILSPIGMIISLVGLSKPPRGFATAGVIIGLIGTLMLFLWVLVLILVSSAIAFAILLGLAVDKWGIMWIETGFDAFKISEAIIAYETENGSLPGSIDDITADEGALVDYWGNPYIVQIDEVDRSIRIRSFGEDGEQGTQDDHILKMSFDFASKDFEWDNLDKSTIIFGEEAEDSEED